MTAVTDLLTRLGLTRVDDTSTIYERSEAASATCAWPRSRLSVRLADGYALVGCCECDDSGKYDEIVVRVSDVTEARVQAALESVVLVSERLRASLLRRLDPGVN